MSTQPPCCARQPNDVISVLAGPLKRRLAALICIVHRTGCTAGCIALQLVVQPAVKCKHRVSFSLLSYFSVGVLLVGLSAYTTTCDRDLVAYNCMNITTAKLQMGGGHFVMTTQHYHYQ